MRPLSSPEDGQHFAQALVRLHRDIGERYGWPHDNFIGANPQRNGQCDDWPDFFVNCRLVPQLVERGHHDGVAPDEWVAHEYARVRRFYAKLGIPEKTEIEFFNGPHTINGQGTFKFAIQPGITLGVEAAGQETVATTGRVLVQVDATHAPVRAGDLLVTSDITGVAMRSEPITIGGALVHRPGTIIGKALQPLANGRGTILVLLSMQ